MKKQIIKKASFVSLILTIIFMPMIVGGTTNYKGTTTTTVNFRSGPGTGYSTISQISNNTQVNVVSTTKIAGTGCSDGWYHITLVNSNTPGYVCSTYLKVEVGIAQDKYLRPWLTPGASIKGGAIFVGESYISKGQFTSYLKKYNVNPNASSSVHNHQYMTNIRAPRGEARTSYTAYNNSGLLNLPLKFSIPIFNNMPDTTELLNESRTNPGQDTTSPEFEAYLEAQGFPESYRRYLRWLHELRPNWIFESLQTGLDWNQSVSIQREVGAIDSTQSHLCDTSRGTNGNCKATEPGWYLPTLEAVAYFLDPRNFLDERHILMFEYLSFSEHFTESNIQYVLNNTFMSGISLLDDSRTYASLFMEAGRNANVNPVYLASLSKQEVGVNGSSTTSGNIFTYGDITYQGLYNFYNIGAVSSSSNPALRGLVWAAGGSPIPIVSEISDAPEKTITNLGYQYAYEGTTFQDYIELFIQVLMQEIPGITREEILLTVKFSATNKDGIAITNEEVLSTGVVLTVEDYEEIITITIVILGDIMGTGIINSADLLAMRQHLLETRLLTGEFFEAADVDGNNVINSADLLVLRQHILGQRTIQL